MRQRRIILLFTLCLAALAAGCGGSGQDIGSSAALPPASAAGRANVTGVLFAPAGVDATAAARMAAQGNSWKSAAVAFAEVALYTMDADGNLIPLGDQYKTTTDANGNFALYYVPPVSNVILLGAKDVKVNGQPKKLKLRKFLSILNKDVITGNLDGGDVDAASTLAVAAMQNILATLNAGLTGNQRLTGADIPPETLAEIQSSIETTLAADQASANPSVDLADLTTDNISNPNSSTAQAAATQLTNLTNSPGGATLTTLISTAATTGSIRVTVKDAAGAAVAGATATLTVSGAATAKTTDAYGQAFFGGLTPGAAAAVSVSAAGYTTATGAATVPAAGKVTDVAMTLIAGTSTTSPDASVSGIVTSAGQPVADAVVSLYNATYSDTTVTDASGAYAFYDVPAGTYYVVATKDNYTLESTTAVVQ
jgi:hypothetical protein